ncbi:hypothetical protein [Burkholderia thailandensis]|uniref:Uncharacterized protein n=1 Tax=Burkholderia thailandensis TaxID=57975 RepID=A0AAW9D072_BURTH|nr:hypothetical protein [Burkholderia thailandensis]AHI67082.1 putative gp12 [Burkholderia thailandensis H0587]AIP67091.1 hypothetical protein DR62_5560 [Burkholderia thailandensis]AJY32094.1 putative gp12 [Burkholderia thailandensis 34]AOI54276.1 hypothetical protein WI24_20625 [Burkholderia thailandensis]AOJ53258.1 hypothetical protein AQ475_20450 [Burkholderia thailandensis]
MKYLYSGPISGVSLQDGTQIREVMLHPGAAVELPEQHEYTKTLLALGHLRPVAPHDDEPARERAAQDQPQAAANDAALKGA